MLGAIASLVSPARLAIEPIRPRGKQLRFGAAVRGLDLSAPLDDAEVRLLSEALAEHGLLLLKGAAPAHVDPHAFVSLMRRLNPGEDLTIWRDQATNPWERHKAERMGPAGTFQLPDCREVLVIGKGELRDHWGLSCALGGARAAYGNSSGSQVIGGGALQWHIDGAMWASPATRASGLPCRTVGMRCVEAPAAEDGGLRLFDVDYGDGSRVGCAAGSTAFCSGATAFSLLTPPERRRALRTTVIYAAHPFKRFAKCSMTKDGLRCVGGADVETPLDDDGGGGDDGDGGGGGGETRGSLRLPLVWASRATGRLALMPHTRCVEALEIAPGDADDEGASQQTVVLGTEEARHYLHGLMRRAWLGGGRLRRVEQPRGVALGDGRPARARAARHAPRRVRRRRAAQRTRWLRRRRRIGHGCRIGLLHRERAPAPVGAGADHRTDAARRSGGAAA